MDDDTNRVTVTYAALTWAYGLAMVFYAALKVGGLVTSSWWWLLAPLWGVFAIVGAFACIFATAALVSGAWDRWAR